MCAHYEDGETVCLDSYIFQKYPLRTIPTIKAQAASSGRHRQAFWHAAVFVGTESSPGSRRNPRIRRGGHVRRIATLWGLAALTVAGASFNTGTMPLRSDSSRAELAKLGQEYGDLQQWVAAIAAASDTLPVKDAERARVLADQQARLMRPLEN
jgi:hypothetical protein